MDVIVALDLFVINVSLLFVPCFLNRPHCFMDRSWIYARRTTDEYEKGVEEFLEFARRNGRDSNGRFYCPCVKCLNERRLNVEEIKDHVLCDGFCKSYT